MTSAAWSTRLASGVLLVAASLLLLAQAAADDEAAIGFLAPYEQVGLGFAESGVIGELRVREGQRVKAGERLASLDNRVIDAAVAIARAQGESDIGLRQAEITLADRRTRHEQLERLRSSGNAREDEVARAALEASIAAVDLEAARHRQAVQQLEYRRMLAQREQRRIASPLDGVVVKVNAKPGETYRVNDEPLIEIVQLDRLLLALDVDEATAARLAGAGRTLLRVDGVEAPVEAVVEFVSPVMDPRSGTFAAKLVVENPQYVLRSGVRAALLAP